MWVNDLDLGPGGVVLLPDQPGAHPHELVSIGKLGIVYLVDRDNLGGYNTISDNIVQELPYAPTKSMAFQFTGTTPYWFTAKTTS
jgi:hypothetical protein